MFENWDETMIWSCLQGVMGEIYANDAEHAAVAVLGDFAFCAGKPDEALLQRVHESCERQFMIVVPQNEAWDICMQKYYGAHAKRVLRYACKKEKDIFDVPKLKQAAVQLPEGYELKPLDEHAYALCQGDHWAKDLVSQFGDYDTYERLGLGVVAYHKKELVAGASSYSRYEEGIEIEIDTRKDHRRKGLAYACGAKLILNCLERGLYPSWDAQNRWSLALAEKLGYHFSHTYTAYEIGF